MAELKPTFTLVEMERTLGYNIDSLNYPNDACASTSIYDLFLSVPTRERKENSKNTKSRRPIKNDTILKKVIPMCDVPQTMAQGRDTVTFTRRTQVGFYSFDVDLHYSFGLDLSLLFTKNEVVRAMTVAKLPSVTPGGLGPLFFKLPKELRDKIYTYAFPEVEWTAGDVDSSYELNVTGGVGDPSGFYFPLSSLGMLSICRQMRQEALPFAYRRTLFHFDDMDDLVKFLIAIGNVGCDNIESLELAWQSRTDSEYQ